MSEGMMRKWIRMLIDKNLRLISIATTALHFKIYHMQKLFLSP